MAKSLLLNTALGGSGQKEATAVGALAQGVRSEEEHAAEKTIVRKAVSEEEQTAVRDGVKAGRVEVAQIHIYIISIKNH